MAAFSSRIQGEIPRNSADEPAAPGRTWARLRTPRRQPESASEASHGDASEGNTCVTINKQVYYLAADGNLAPSKKDQPPPDLRYFNQPRK
jgi:hypothetical protein